MGMDGSMTSNAIDKINDVLAEINLVIGDLPSEVNPDMRKALEVTHSLAWQLIELTISECKDDRI